MDDWERECGIEKVFFPWHQYDVDAIAYKRSHGQAGKGCCVPFVVNVLQELAVGSEGSVRQFVPCCQDPSFWQPRLLRASQDWETRAQRTSADPVEEERAAFPGAAIIVRTAVDAESFAHTLVENELTVPFGIVATSFPAATDATKRRQAAAVGDTWGAAVLPNSEQNVLSAVLFDSHRHYLSEGCAPQEAAGMIVMRMRPYEPVNLAVWVYGRVLPLMRNSSRQVDVILVGLQPASLAPTMHDAMRTLVDAPPSPRSDDSVYGAEDLALEGVPSGPKGDDAAPPSLLHLPPPPSSASASLQD